MLDHLGPRPLLRSSLKVSSFLILLFPDWDRKLNSRQLQLNLYWSSHRANNVIILQDRPIYHSRYFWCKTYFSDLSIKTPLNTCIFNFKRYYRNWGQPDHWRSNHCVLTEELAHSWLPHDSRRLFWPLVGPRPIPLPFASGFTLILARTCIPWTPFLLWGTLATENWSKSTPPKLQLPTFSKLQTKLLTNTLHYSAEYY